MIVVTALGIQKADFGQPLPLLWPREIPRWSREKSGAVLLIVKYAYFRSKGWSLDEIELEIITEILLFTNSC